MDDISKGGRPTLYRGEYCQQLIDHMASGLSFESFAAVINVNRDTLYEWEKTQEAFSDAKKEGLQKNLLFWEKLGVNHVLNETLEEENRDEGTTKKSSKSLNSTIWIFNMKNRHKWRDKQPDEADVIVNNNNGKNLTDEELNAKIDEKLSKLKGGDESK